MRCHAIDYSDAAAYALAAAAVDHADAAFAAVHEAMSDIRCYYAMPHAATHTLCYMLDTCLINDGILQRLPAALL